VWVPRREGGAEVREVECCREGDGKSPVARAIRLFDRTGSEIETSNRDLPNRLTLPVDGPKAVIKHI